MADHPVLGPLGQVSPSTIPERALVGEFTEKPIEDYPTESPQKPPSDVFGIVTSGVALVVVGILIGFLVGFECGKTSTRDKMQEESVRAGRAEWKSGLEGQPMFQWKEFQK